MKRFSSELPYVMLIENDDQQVPRFQRLFSSIALHWGQIRIEDGAAAVHHMIFEGFPDLIVTRLKTPKHDAVDLAEWLGAIKCTKPVPIMVYDTVDDPEIARRLSLQGVKDNIDRNLPEEKVKQILWQKVIQVECHAARNTKHLA